MRQDNGSAPALDAASGADLEVLLDLLAVPELRAEVRVISRYQLDEQGAQVSVYVSPIWVFNACCLVDVLRIYTPSTRRRSVCLSGACPRGWSLRAPQQRRWTGAMLRVSPAQQLPSSSSRRQPVRPPLRHPATLLVGTYSL